LAEGKRTYVTN